MKTLNENKKWSAGLTDYLYSTEKEPRPKIGDDDGISDKAMNVVIVLFMLLTVGVTIAAANPTRMSNGSSPALFSKALDDMDHMRYQSAINKLQRVRKLSPENANIDYLLGKCYLHGDISAEKAAFYLSQAIQHVSASYEPWNVSEDSAPIEAVYLLARAYERTEHFDLAYHYYTRFIALLEGGPVKPESRTFLIVMRAAEKCKAAAVSQDQIAFNKN